MKTRNEKMNISILGLAVQCALMTAVALPLNAVADDADALKRPTNSVELGSLYSSQNSARFGQYNGLNDGGFYGLGGFDVHGGDGYNDSKNSALRWNLNGSNLGTTSRTVDGSVSDQGKWKVNLGYDELQHNITSTYQTPLQGSVGGNNFTLPANFGPIGTTAVPNTRSLSSTQRGDFNTEKENVSRKNGSISTSYTFSEQLSAQIDYNHLDQSGAKLIGTGSMGGINVGTGSGSGGYKGAAEAVNMLMNPTSYQTDNVNAALNWRGDKGHFTGGYYGSMFHDDYNSLNWQSAVVTPGTSGTCAGANCYTNNTMSTAPSNSLHQANLTGGYNFTQTTKLAGGFSYGHNSQNSAYAPTNIAQVNGSSANMMWGGLPGASLNGVVETTHGDLKLTNQSIKDLTLTAGFKFNERDNRTDSSIYKFKAINDALATNTTAATNYTGVNTPYSNSKTQYEASAAYRLTKAQNVNLAYDHESVKRWCDSLALGAAQCVSSPASEEDKIGLTYRLKALDDVNFNAGYSYANRRADVSNFQSNVGNYGITSLITSSATGSANSGFNAGNFLGYVAFPYANRSQNLGKAGVNWQVTQKLDVGLNGRYTYDNYDATLGVQNGHSAGVNLDATYSYAENSSVSAYWSWQNGQRNMRSGNGGANGNTSASVVGAASQAVAPTNLWNNQLEDNSNTVGLLTRRGGLLNGKLDLIGDASYARDTTGYSTQVLYTPSTNIACGSAASLTCGSLSPIANEIISLKFTGHYKVHKNGKVSLAYMYQKLNSNDYFYYGQQFSTTPSTVMPTNLQMQSYAVNVVALSYNYSF
ncbi:MAG: MtrB/PioB family decaheme-associated outer membrane protein [Methylococcales bacterium]|nr:MtrB/PioB family decaheme-associated outer membrane protein [Methylococcales bacterium]